jgi:hypothetical protein
MDIFGSLATSNRSWSGFGDKLAADRLLADPDLLSDDDLHFMSAPAHVGAQLWNLSNPQERRDLLLAADGESSGKPGNDTGGTAPTLAYLSPAAVTAIETAGQAGASRAAQQSGGALVNLCRIPAVLPACVAAGTMAPLPTGGKKQELTLAADMRATKFGDETQWKVQVRQADGEWRSVTTGRVDQSGIMSVDDPVALRRATGQALPAAVKPKVQTRTERDTSLSPKQLEAQDKLKTDPGEEPARRGPGPAGGVERGGQRGDGSDADTSGKRDPQRPQLQREAR